MASKTGKAPSRPAARTGRSPARGGGTSRRTAPASSRRGPGPGTRLAARTGTWLATDEGLVCTLGLGAAAAVLLLWFELGGPLASIAGFLTGTAFGLARHLLPLALAGAAVGLARGQRHQLGRLGCGLALSAVGLAGILHLARMGPGLEIDVDGWRQAGGMVGAVAADPVRSAIGSLLTGVLMGMVCAAGLTIALRIPPRQVASLAGR
ncbi:MAG: DNA translocase FtsK 4TM domain-containing protein, partial [Acidimicrobiia bacterium]